MHSFQLYQYQYGYQCLCINNFSVCLPDELKNMYKLANLYNSSIPF